MTKKTVIAFLLFFSVLAAAQNVTVKATTDSLNYLIGDYIHYKIIIDAPPETEVFVPPFVDSLKDLVLIKKENVSKSKSESGARYEYDFILSGYDSLDTEIPPVPVILKNKGSGKYDTLLTNKVSVFVSKVKTDPEKDIKDIKNILTVPYDWKTLALILLGVLLFVGLAYFVYKKFIRKEKPQEERTKIKVVLPPHKLAYKKLNELENEKLWQNGKIKEYHSRLTEIIREYFEKRFGFNSLEMTSAETLDELRRRNVSLEVLQTAERFLSNADMVKFAKFQPMPKVNEDMLKEAYRIVDLTKPPEVGETNNV